MSECPSLLIDGNAETTLPADDRGLAYGDGVFRTLCVVNGQAVARDNQWRRLASDCARLGLPAPCESALDRDLSLLCGSRGRFVAKVVITRGSGGRGYTPPDTISPRRIVSRHAMPPTVETLGVLEIAKIRLAEQPALAGVKHLNRLEQVLARDECRRRNVADLAMCDADGRLTATTMRNLLFADRAGHWYTPHLDRAGVAGVTRDRLMHARRACGRAVMLSEIRIADLGRFEAAVACNSVGGALAVSAIADHGFHDSAAMAEQAAMRLAESA